MKKYLLFAELLIAALVVLTCTSSQSTQPTADEDLEILPLCKLASSLAIDDIARAEAVVSSEQLDEDKVFALLVDNSNSRLYGTLKLPMTVTACDVIIRLYDAQDRKIGEGSYALTRSHFDAGKCVTAEIGIESAKPRIDSLYANQPAVGINDTIFLHAMASDSFGGTLSYEWQYGNGSWGADSASPVAIAPSQAQAYTCRVRVTDNDGHSIEDSVVITVETRSPTVVACNDTTVGINDSVYLYGNATDETRIDAYAWKCGAGNWNYCSTADTVAIVPSQATAWVCSLRVSDDDGNVAYDAVTVTVEWRSPSIIVSPDTTVGINDVVHLRGSASSDETGIAEYAWKCGAGEWLTDGDGDTTVTAPETAQTWICSLKVTDTESNSSYEEITVTVETRAPVALTANDTAVGINDEVSLHGSASSDETAIVEYAWKCGDGSWLTDEDGDTVVAAPATAQSWVCSLKVTDDDGNSTTDEMIVTVETRAPTAYAGSDTTVGINDDVQLRGSASTDETAIVEYAWKCGDGSWLTDEDGDTVVAAPATAQSWVCSLKVTDDEDNISFDEVRVTVEARAPVAQTGPDTTVGINDDVYLRGSASTDETAIVEYAWKCGNGEWIVDEDGDTTVAAPATAQSWACSLRVIDDDGETSFAATVVAVETRAPIAQTGPDTTVGIYDTIHLRGSGSSDETAIAEFAWKCGSGSWLSDGDGDTTIIAPATAQTLVCSLKVTDDEGNESYAAVQVTVETRAPTAIAGDDTSVGIKDDIYLNGTASSDESGIVEYAWKCGAGSWGICAGDTLVSAPSTAQSLACSLRVTDDDGNQSFGLTTVTVETRPPVAGMMVSANDTLLPDDAELYTFTEDVVTLYASRSGDETSIQEFAWKIGGGNWTVTAGTMSLNSSGDTIVSGDWPPDTIVQAPSTVGFWACSLRVRDDDGNYSYAGAEIALNKWTTYTDYTDVGAIAKDHDGTLWFGNSTEPVSFDGGTWTSYSGTFPGGAIKDIAVDESNNVWFATETNGVSFYNGTGWTTYSTADGLASNEVSAVTVDKYNVKWFGTSNGLSAYDGTDWTTYDEFDGLPANLIVDVAIDSASDTVAHVWITQLSDGVSYFDGSSWTTYSASAYFDGNTTHNVIVNNDGTVWVKTFHGLYSFNGSTWLLHAVGSSSIENIAVDSDGDIWFTDWSGLAEYNGLTVKSYAKGSGRCILVEDNHTIWLGTGASSLFKLERP